MARPNRKSHGSSEMNAIEELTAMKSAAVDQRAPQGVPLVEATPAEHEDAQVGLTNRVTALFALWPLVFVVFGLLLTLAWASVLILLPLMLAGIW
jgi:hypothetical protein